MAQEPSNLTMHRGDRSVWERQDYEHSRGRMQAAIGLLLIGAGTVLVARSYKSELASALKCRMKAVMPRWRKFDEVNDASEESFPASDAPAWSPTVGKAAEP